MDQFQRKIKFARETTNILYACGIGAGFFFFFINSLYTKKILATASSETSYTDIASIIHNGFRHPVPSGQHQKRIYTSPNAPGPMIDGGSYYGGVEYYFILSGVRPGGYYTESLQKLIKTLVPFLFLIIFPGGWRPSPRKSEATCVQETPAGARGSLVSKHPPQKSK